MTKTIKERRADVEKARVDLNTAWATYAYAAYAADVDDAADAADAAWVAYAAADAAWVELAELEGEPLGAEFEAVWDANKRELYEP